MSYKTSLSIANLREREIVLYLEPWGEQIAMPTGVTFQIVAKAERQGDVEIQYEEEGIVVWGWEGSVLDVFCNGKAVSVNHPQVPPVPKGTSVSSFIRSLLKNE